METDRIDIDDRLTLIHGDLQKVIRHFKLDRRLKNNSDDPDAVPDADTERDRQISEILKRLGDISDRREFTPEQIAMLDKIITAAVNYCLKRQSDNHNDLGSTLQSIEKQLGELKQQKPLSVDTQAFEQLNHYFIARMESKLRRVKQPSNGLKWYIAMWIITLLSAFLAGYFIHGQQEWKDRATYWYEQYETVKEEKK
jgi:chromosome segregation ATPase